MDVRRKQRIGALLKGIETGDPQSVEVIHPDKYIQHNPQTHEGRKGLAALFQRLAASSPRVNLVRVFADGEYVFAHTEYDFATRRIGFEVFRFEGEQAVEHWDNIQPRLGPNGSGHTMVDGPTEFTEPERREQTRTVVQRFVESILIALELERLEQFVDAGQFVQHDPTLDDNLASLCAVLQAGPARGIRYERLHRVLAEGDFALSVCEGSQAGIHTAFYDLFRVAGGRIVEHWNTLERVAPTSEWKNNNGKF